jgi:carbonic anhydrase
MESDQDKKVDPSYLKQSQERIFENNRKWVASRHAMDPTFFEKLAAGQTPDYL